MSRRQKGRKKLICINYIFCYKPDQGQEDVQDGKEAIQIYEDISVSYMINDCISIREVHEIT